MTKKSKAPATTSTAKRRWSIGLFRNASGALVTVYVTADGVPMPYEAKRVHGKILFHAVYSGMKYSAARQKLLKESGLKDKKVEVKEKAVAKKAGAAKAAKKSAAKKPAAKKSVAKEEHLKAA